MNKIYKLTDIVNFIGGSQPPKSDFSEEKKDGYIRLIQIRDYKSDDYAVYIPENSTKKFCTEDDIMIGRYGPPVFQILRGISGAYNVALMKAEPKIKELFKEYLFRFLQSPSIQNYIIALSQRSAGQSGVNKEALEQYEIMLPSFEEQKRIVAKLDNLFAKIDKAIALHQKNIDEANVFMASVLNDVFIELEERFQVKALKDISNIISGYAFKSGDFSNDNEIKSIKITNVGVQNFVEENDNLLPKEMVKKLSKYIANYGDIAIALTRPYISDGLKVTFVPKTYDGAFINQRVAVIQSNEEFTSNNFIYHYLCTSNVLSNVMELSKTLNQPNLSIKDLSNFEIPLPSLKTQQKVVSYLDEISNKMEKIKQIQKEKMQSLKALKASILDQAFRGEL